MTDNYGADAFHAVSDNSNGRQNDASQPHNLKLSVDLNSVRNMTVAANVFLTYQLHLMEVHTFQSSPPTAVSQSRGQDTKLANAFV